MRDVVPLALSVSFTLPVEFEKDHIVRSSSHPYGRSFSLDESIRLNGPAGIAVDSFG